MIKEEMSVDQIVEQFAAQEPAKPVTPLVDTPNVFEMARAVPPDNRSVEEILAEAGEEEEIDPAETEEAKIVQTKSKAKDTLTDADLGSVQMLIEAGKLQPWVDESNQIVLPRTKAELLELMDENLNTINEQSYQNVQNQFYTEKSPIWQTLLKFSENARSLDEIAPLFNTIQQASISANLNVENEQDQETIIMQLGLIQGLDKETILNDIEDLKERGKLRDRAEKAKPGLDRYNEQKVNQELARKEQEENQRQYQLQSHYNSVVNNVIAQKEIGGVKMKDEHRQYIASTLVPDESLGGLPIYTLIDNLLKNGQYDVLSRISLLATDPKVHDNYYGAKKANEVANSLQRKLRDANSMQSGSVVSTENTQSPKKPMDLNERSKQWL